MTDHTSSIDKGFGNGDDWLPGVTPYCSRVLLIAKRATGGMWAVRLTRDLAERGATVHVVVPTWGPDVAAYRAAGATVHFCRTTLPLAHPLRATHVLRQLRRLVQQIDPQIVYPLHASAAVAIRLACSGFHPAGSSHHSGNIDETSPLILGSRAPLQGTQILARDRLAHVRRTPGLRLVTPRHDGP